MRKLIYVLGLAALLATSCANPKNVQFKGIDKVKMNGITKAEIGFGVNNNSSHKITFTDGRLDLMRKDFAIAEMRMDEEIVVPRKFEGSVNIPIKINYPNPLGIFSALQKASQKPDDFTVRGEIRVKSGWGSRKIEFEDIPLSEFLNKFGVNPSDLEKLFNL